MTHHIQVLGVTIRIYKQSSRNWAICSMVPKRIGYARTFGTKREALQAAEVWGKQLAKRFA